MRVAVAGAHGKIALRLGRLLAARGDEVVGLVRNPDHAEDLRSAGVHPVVVDLETAGPEEVADALRGAQAAVFAAGAGPGSGAARKDSVDRGGAVLLAEAAERARVRRFVLVSSVGVDAVRAGAEPAGLDAVMLAYLQAKLAAEEDLVARPLDWTVLRPGRLTDDPGTGRVRLAARVPDAVVPRDDVAAVLAALVAGPSALGRVLELGAGETPVAEAVAAA